MVSPFIFIIASHKWSEGIPRGSAPSSSLLLASSGLVGSPDGQPPYPHHRHSQWSSEVLRGLASSFSSSPTSSDWTGSQKISPFIVIVRPPDLRRSRRAPLRFHRYRSLFGPPSFEILNASSICRGIRLPRLALGLVSRWVISSPRSFQRLHQRHYYWDRVSFDHASAMSQFFLGQQAILSSKSIIK